MNVSDGAWRERFATPRLWTAQVARGDRGKGVVAVQSQEALTLRVWDVAAGSIGTTGTVTDGFTDSYWLSPDGQLIYRLADEGGNELGHVEAVCLADGATRDLTPDLEPYTLRGGDASLDGSMVVFAPCNRDGFKLVAAPTDGSTPARALYSSRSEAWNPHISADGRLAVIDTTDHNPGVRSFTVSAFDVLTGDRLAALPAAPGRSVTAVCFSPVRGDGRVLVAAESDFDGHIRPAIWEPLTGQLAYLDLPTAAQDMDAVPVDWSPNGQRILLVTAQYGVQHVVIHDLESGQSTQLGLPPGSYWLPEVRQPWFDQSGGVLAPVEDAAAALRVLAWSPTGTTTMALQPPATRPGQLARSVTFASADATVVQGWLITPPGKGPFPTVIHLHGGPHWFAPDAYSPTAAAWAEHGFAHLDLNYRGSTGRGSKFARQIWGDVGRLELQDLAAARRWLVDTGIASPTAMFVNGESYGGYLTLYALARQPELWAAGFAAIAIADWTQAYRDASDALKSAMSNWFGGTPEELPDLYRDRSPLTHVDAVSCPVVVVQAENDTRTAPAQMRAFEQAMQVRGKDLTVHWLDAGHGLGGAADEERAFEWFLDAATRLLAQSGVS